MPREIDERKKRKALRKLRKAAMLAEQGLGPELSDWEKQFLEEVEERIETYGSAFADPSLGAPDAPLSALQEFKLKEIDKKARGKGKGFARRSGSDSSKRKTPQKIRQKAKINYSIKNNLLEDKEGSVLKSENEVNTGPTDAPSSPRKVRFRIIDGGKS